MARVHPNSRSRSWLHVVPDADPEAAVAERIRYRQIGEQAHREMLEKFGPLTPENAHEAIQWQANRILDLQGL